MTSQKPLLDEMLDFLRLANTTDAIAPLETVLGKENCGRTNWKIYFMSVCCWKKACYGVGTIALVGISILTNKSSLYWHPQTT